MPVILQVHPKDNSTISNNNPGKWILFDQDIFVDPIGSYSANCTGPGFCPSLMGFCGAWMTWGPYAFINFTGPDATNWNVQFDGSCFRNAAFEYHPGYSLATDWNFTLGTGTGCTWQDPCFTPLDDATGVSVSTNFEINMYTAWDGDVNGRITVFDSPSTMWRQGSVLSSPEISGQDTTTFIYNPSPDLSGSETYHVNIDALYENGGAAFLRFNDSTTWNFTTASVPPELTCVVPIDNGTAEAIGDGLFLHFDQPVDFQTGNITIFDASTDLAVETLAVSSGIGNGEANVYFARSVALSNNSNYYIEIDSTAFDNALGDSFPGFTDNGVWNFSVLRNISPLVGRENIVETNFNAPADIIAVDLDGDDDVDIVASGYNANQIVWYENDGTGNFAAAALIASGFSVPRQIDAKDADGDGDVDLIVPWMSSNMVSYYENDGTETFTRRDLDLAAAAAIDTKFTDLDGDGDIDVVAALFTAGRIVWYENDGSMSFAARQNISPAVSGPIQIEVGDIDLDGDIDVLASLYSADTVVWYENDGSESFSANNIHTSFDEAYGNDIGDIDGDGDMDIVATARNADDIYWYENDGSENFISNQHAIDTNYNGPTDAVIVDIDGDNDADILTVARHGDEVTVYVNDGSENFSELTVKSSFTGAYSIVHGDFDADGYRDIAASAFDDDDISWWSFAPVFELETLVPPDNGTAIDVDTSLTMIFSQAVETQTGNVEIRQVANGNLIESIPISAATGNGTDTLIINPTVTFPYSTDLYVTVAATAIDSLSGESFAGFSAATQWNFQTVGQPTWYGCDFHKRIKLQVQAAQVNGDQTNFPIFVDLADLVATGIFTDLDANGADLRVTEIDGTTELPIEVVDVDTGANTGEIHFRADNLSGSQNTTFFLYYDNPDAELYANGDTYGSDNVWSNNYVGVWHLNENPTGTVFDSTLYNHDASSSGSMTVGDLVTGRVGSALDFDGGDDYLEIADTNDLSFTSTSSKMTLSAWVNLDSVGANYNLVGKYNSNSSDIEYALTTRTTNELRSFSSETGAAQYSEDTTTTPVVASSWLSLSMTMNMTSNVMNAYVDGLLQADTVSTGSFPNDMSNRNAPFSIASVTCGTGLYCGHTDGRIDEVRLSGVERTSAWIETEYNNQNSSSTFYTAEADTDYPLSQARILHFSPPDNAYMVNRQQGLLIIFDRNMQKGTGNLYVRRYSDDAIIRTVDVTGSEVTVTNNVVSIENYGTINANEKEQLYIDIDAGALEEQGSGLDYECLDGTKDKWNFTSVKHANTGF